jgi:plasmid maintenance system killer protein
LKLLVKHIKTFVLACFLLAAHQLQAQYKIQGTVYDSSRSYPMVSVSVLSTNGNGAVTDANGHYSISVGEKDSIWFSYLGKPTIKFPVLKIADVSQFDISLQVSITVLKEVKVMPRNYKQDSIQNRLDYAKIFDFQKPNLGTMTSIGPTGAGIDMNELIRVFQFRKNKSTLRFQERLLQQEQDKSIDHRFNKALVRRLTNLSGEELDKFMVLYRPTYEFTLYSSDYDFQLYIKESYKIFMKQNPTVSH